MRMMLSAYWRELLGQAMRQNVRALAPGHARPILRDVFGRSGRDHANSSQANVAFIDSAAAWLARAQDIAGDGGVPAAYSMVRGWLASYVETTGYIIPSMFDYAEYARREDFRRRALDMADWLVALQMPEGAFQGGTVAARAPSPRVFNTGQVMLGLLRAYRERGDDRYLAALRRAADWLLTVQDEDGGWRRFNLHPGMPTYNTRVAWPLAALGVLTDERVYVHAAKRFFERAAERQLPNGWLEGAETGEIRGGLTHFLAYAASGFLEGGRLLGDSSYVQAARAFGDAALGLFLRDGDLAASYARDWRPCYRFSCLTGNAQIAIIWLQLHQLVGGDGYLQAAQKMNRRLGTEIDLGSRHPGIRGALKGASPIWGHYMRFAYPNWATKFFLDALLLEAQLRE